MYGVAFSIVKNEDESQDVVHNVVYKLLILRADKFPISSELTWLYSVVKNEALMFLRQKPNVIAIDEIISPIIDEDRNIYNFVDMDEFNSMLKGLSEQQKQVVTLKVLGGYTHKEIAQMLHKPIGTIQWLYNTAVKKLRMILSSLIVAIIVSGVAFMDRLTNYIYYLQSMPETPNQTLKMPFDISIIVYGAMFLIFIVTFVLIYINSYKISIKAQQKSIKKSSKLQKHKCKKG